MRTVLKGCSIRKVEKHCIMGSFYLLSVRSQGLTEKKEKKMHHSKTSKRCEGHEEAVYRL